MDRDFTYFYVCVGNLLFIETGHSNRGNGLAKMGSLECECVEKRSTYKNILGIDVKGIEYELKIKRER